MAWWCEDGQLPDAGGVYDQDYNLMLSMSAALNIFRTVRKLNNSVGAQIHNLTDSERVIIRRLMEWGML